MTFSDPGAKSTELGSPRYTTPYKGVYHSDLGVRAVGERYKK